VKGQVYSLLEMPLKATELAELLGYKSPSNARVHLRKLVEHGLVRHRADHRYERGDGYLDRLPTSSGFLAIVKSSAPVTLGTGLFFDDCGKHTNTGRELGR
jgi:DNA-binding transcriptional ArsR family regulator